MAYSGIAEASATVEVKKQDAESVGQCREFPFKYLCVRCVMYLRRQISGLSAGSHITSSGSL